MITHEEEREGIARVYAAKSDEELKQLARDSSQLSDAARQILQSEFEKRGLPLPAEPSSGYVVAETSDLVTLRKFRDLPEALLAKGALESAGIESQLVDDNMIRMDWFISNLLGGIKLQVHAGDLETANEVLNQPIPHTIDVEGVGHFEQPKCPQCGSLDVSFRELDKLLSYGSAYVGIPIPVHQKAWCCHACGHEWEDDAPLPGDSDQP
jgi:hypothetical protein